MTLVVYEGPSDSGTFAYEGGEYTAARGVAIDVPLDALASLPSGWVPLAHLGDDGTVGGSHGSVLTPSVVSASPTGGIPAWVTGTAYPVNVLVSNSGTNYICNTAHTAAATFGADAANWTALGGGGVTTFNTRAGAVTLSKADVTGTGLAAADVGADASGAAAAETTRAQAAEALLVPLSQKAAASGVATLDSGTKIPVAQLPASAVTGSSTGTHAARPAAASVSNYLYYETDTGLTYWSDGTTWNLIKPGGELGSAQITSASSVVTSATATAVTGLLTTVTVGVRPIRIMVSALSLESTSAAAYVGHVGLFEDGTQIAGCDGFLPSQFTMFPVAIAARRAPSAGSHTYSVSIWSDGTHGVALEATASAPALIEVVEV